MSAEEFASALQRALGDGFRLDRELGGGGMSRVFVAHDLKLNRKIAVKVLSADLTSELSAERFAREVLTAARLQQANILPVLSAGASHGVPYFTMPFVRGESLRAELARGTTLPLSDRVSVLRDVARALAYAHSEGVVHRDIKPDNILLSSGAAIVTDFGIAKAISASRTGDGSKPASGDGTLTQVGHSIGTPAYMAPEQAVGEEVDHRADIYAWGVVAYELLSGAHPFAGKIGAAQLIAAHIAETPRPLEQVVPELPHELSALVMQCLAKSPAERPAGASVLVKALSNVSTLSGESVARRVAPPTRSRRGSLIALAMVAVVIAAGYLWKSQAGSPTLARTVVVIPFENLGDSTNGYFAEGISEEIGNQLARIPGLQVIGRSGARQYQGSTKTPQQIARELGAAYVLTGTVQWDRSGSGVNGDTRVRISPALLNAETGLREWGNAFNESLNDVFKVQADVAERVALELSIKLAPAQQAALRRPESSDANARDAQLLGRHFLRQRGLQNLRRAVTEFQRAIDRDSSYARAWAGYAEAYVLLPSYLDTVSNERALAESRRAAERAVALDSMLPEAHVALARALWTDYQFTPALAAIERAIRLDPSSALAYQQKFETLMAIGRVDAGDSAIRRAISLDEKVPLLHFEQFVVFAAREQPDSMLASIDRAIALDSDRSTYWHGARWATLGQMGRHDEAVQACVLFTATPPLCDALTPHVPAQPGELDALFKTLATIVRDPNGSSVLPLTVQGGLYAKFGRADEAFERLAKAFQLRDPNLLSLQFWSAFQPLHADPRWKALISDIRSR